MMLYSRALLLLILLVVRQPAHAAADQAGNQPGNQLSNQLSKTIDQVKPSVVGIGNFDQARVPALSFTGTGFVIGDGLTVISAAHVINGLQASGRGAPLGVLVRDGETVRFRNASVVAMDLEHDLARLRIKGTPLPALRLGDAQAVREGQSLAFMGFPLGMVLGLHHATHRCTVSAITPLAAPANSGLPLLPG